jgi:hypothetical protein
VLWYGSFFGYGLHDDDALALGGIFYLFVVVYLGMLWFILLLFGLVRHFTCFYHLQFKIKVYFFSKSR